MPSRVEKMMPEDIIKYIFKYIWNVLRKDIDKYIYKYIIYIQIYTQNIFIINIFR